MGVGTSKGAYYDDAFHHAAAQWDDKYDDNEPSMKMAIDKKLAAFPEGGDQDMVINPTEISPDTPNDEINGDTALARSFNQTPNERVAGAFSKLHYDTPLTPTEETEFQKWKAKNAPRDSGSDYDLRGAFKAGLQPDTETGHWPDTFKKPNHPTFSDQSMYAVDRPDLAGSWDGEFYVPPAK